MFLNRVCALFTATFIAVTAFAQQPAGNRTPPNVHQLQQPAETVTYTSAADVAALIARAKNESTDKTPMVVGKLLQLAPYNVVLEYRPSGKSVRFNAGAHEKAAELFYVLEGSGTLVTGGKLTADRMGIDGGESQKVSKGDLIFVPEGTPHWISHVDQSLVLMSLHVPRPVPAQ